MADRRDGESAVLFHSTTAKGKGVIRKLAGSDDLFQIRCVYVDPDWSEPWTLDFIREHYCYEGARCVIGAVVANQVAGRTPTSCPRDPGTGRR